MRLPDNAPDWAAPLVAALTAADFAVEAESHGGMAGYALTLARDDCKVTVGGDRGDFDSTLAFPSPLSGRGHPAVQSMPAEDYVAAVRGDADASFLLSASDQRNAEVASWLISAIAGSARLPLDEPLLRRVQVLQRERAKALFG